jgi:hypothetical protein
MEHPRLFSKIASEVPDQNGYGGLYKTDQNC